VKTSLIYCFKTVKPFRETQINKPSQKTAKSEQERSAHPKWATFTYIGKQTKYITKSFKKTDTRISYRTQNAIENLLRIQMTREDIYKKVVYTNFSAPIA
jgi:hypothetical protein